MKTLVLLLAIFVGAEVRAQEPAPAVAPPVAAAKPALSPIQLNAVNAARKSYQVADVAVKATKAYKDYMKAAEKLKATPEFAAFTAAEAQLKTIELLVK